MQLAVIVNLAAGVYAAAITGSSISDGTATLNNGTLTGLASLSTGTITGTTLTDGVATLNQGVLTGLASLTTSGLAISNDLTLTGANNQFTFNNDNVSNQLTWTPSGSKKTITFPNETGTVCTTASICAGYSSGSGSGSYIQNASSQQSGANFNISGNGVIGGTLGVTGSITGGSLGTAGAITGGSLAINGVVTGGTYNGQTVGAAAAFGTSVTAPTVNATTLTVTNNASIGGNLALTGNLAVNTNKFTVDSSGNTAIAGIFSINSHLTVDPSTGYLITDGGTNIGGVLNVTGKTHVTSLYTAVASPITPFYDITASDSVINELYSGGQVNLPASETGRVITIINDTIGTTLVHPFGGAAINGDTSNITLAAEYNTITLVGVGGGWLIVNTH